MSENSSEKSLYERLGGIYNIAAVVSHFAEKLAEDPVAGENANNFFIRDWYSHRRWREAGFIVLTTLWVAEKAGGPYRYVSSNHHEQDLDLEPTHYNMRLTSEEFDAAGKVLAETLDHFKVAEREKNQVLDAFMAHKEEVISGTIK